MTINTPPPPPHDLPVPPPHPPRPQFPLEQELQTSFRAGNLIRYSQTGNADGERAGKKAAVEPLTEGTIGHAADRLLADATLLYALRLGGKKKWKFNLKLKKNTALGTNR